MPSHTFSANAVLTHGRWRHHRGRDHYGADSDLYIVLDAPLGQWPQYTPIHYVLDDLASRVLRIEGTSIKVSLLTADAYLTGFYFFADGITKRTMAATLTADAAIGPYMGLSSFTADAWFRAAGSFTANAVLI